MILLEILLELGGWSAAGILEAVAGLLWPSEEPAVRRLQRICSVLLFAGLGFVLGACALAYLAPSWHVLTLIVVAGVLFIFAGAVGNSIEKRCKTKLLND